MSKKYSLEKAQNEARKMKDIVGSRGQKENYDTAEKIINEKKEASEKETRKLAGELAYAVEIKSSPSSLEKLPNFNILRTGVNNTLKTLKRFGSYNLTESNEFPEENFSAVEWYKNLSDMYVEYLSRRLSELDIKSEDDLRGKLEKGALTVESIKGTLDDIFSIEQITNNLRTRFFYSKAVDDYIAIHPQISGNLPKEYSPKGRRVEEYGFQKSYIQVTRFPSIDLSNEFPFPNPNPIEKYNPDDESLTLYPAYEYSVTRIVASTAGTGAESEDSLRKDESGVMEEYTHVIALRWYTSLARAAQKTQEAIERTKLNLESGKSSVERYKQFQNEQTQKEKTEKDAGALKLYRFESFDRDIESKGVFMIDGGGILVSPTEEQNLSEGRYGKKDRSKGITRIEKTWNETPTRVSVISYDVTRNKARTQITINFKLEVLPPSGLTNLQKQNVQNTIRQITNEERKKMSKINQFDVQIEKSLQNAGITIE